MCKYYVRNVFANYYLTLGGNNASLNLFLIAYKYLLPSLIDSLVISAELVLMKSFTQAGLVLE